MPWYVLPHTDGKRIWLDAERPDFEKAEPAPEKPAGKKAPSKPTDEDE